MGRPPFETMNAQVIIDSLLGRAGQHCPVTWHRLCKTRKGAAPVTKKTTAYVRTGIDFANLASVKAGIASGERGEVQSLPWGEWARFPYIIAHKGQEYVRLYPASFANLRPVVQYFQNGQPVAFEAVSGSLLASELPSGEQPECFTVKAGDVESIG
jgi:hypothetical protein